jgi:glucosylceramidase
MSRLLQSYVFAVFATCALLAACSTPEGDGADYRISTTTQILLTSEAGDKLATQENVSFQTGESQGTTVVVNPDIVKQTIVGIGSSFTESSAFVLAHLDPEARADVMDKFFSERGANFSLTRTPIGSTDFSVEGKYSYAEVPDDLSLEHFTIAPDKDGFLATEYPGIRDEKFDLLPMIKQALTIKSRQNESELRIVASAWTAPPLVRPRSTGE